MTSIRKVPSCLKATILAGIIAKPARNVVNDAMKTAGPTLDMACITRRLDN